MELNKVALKKLKTYKLKVGSHSSRDEGMCAMEMVAFIAGEKHSDMPDCVCPTISRFVMRLNDKMNDKERPLLKPYLIKLVGTKDSNHLKRAKILAHAALTIFAPLALDAAKLHDHAEKLRALKFGDWKEGRKLAREAKSAASAYASAAYAYAASASAYAASAYAYAAYTSAASAASAAYASASASASAYAASAYAADASASARKLVFKEALKVLDQILEIK